jgi:hypothetical protein
MDPRDQEKNEHSPKPADDFQRDVVDRRSGADRRQTPREQSGYTGPERRVEGRRTGLERRRGAGIRREEDRRSAEEGEMTVEQFEFVQAIELFKKKNDSLYPTWIDIFTVSTQLGYTLCEPNTVDLSDAATPTLDPAWSAAQRDFVVAVETYKKVNKKRFPTWTEVFEVVLQLGYRKTARRSLDLGSTPEPRLWVIKNAA